MAADVLQFIGSAVDRVVGVFNPDRALSRHRARQLLARAYEGASRKDGWNPRRAGASANTDHLVDASSLRARSRALVQNVPYISQGLAALVANAIGTGIVPRWTGKEATTYNKLWKAWSKVCDADGRFDIYGLQAAAYRAQQQDGEVLIRLRPRLASDGLPVPLQLQLLEIDWLDSLRTMANGNNRIINGIEYDQLGRVVGYWLFDEHPGDMSRLPRSGLQSKFVPADRIIHLYKAERPGQGRGFPRIAPVIARVRDLQLYEDAELQRKNLETRLSVVASGNVADLANPNNPNDPVDTQAAKSGDLGPLQSGAITQLPPGMNLTAIEPKVAGGYVEYLKFNLHLIASGWGVTYEMMTGDVSDTNFSSARVNRLNFQRQVEMEQWTDFIPKFCVRVEAAFADAAFLAGEVRAPDYEIEHATPKWDYVNPEQEVKSDLDEIAGGLSTISEKLRRRGYQPEQVFAEMKSDFDRLRADGTLDVMLSLLAKKVPPAPVDAAGAARAERAEQSMDLVRETLRNIQEEVRVAALRAPVAVPPAPAIHLNVQAAPAPQVSVTNDVRSPDQPAPVVHVHNEVRAAEQPAPIVNVHNEVRAADAPQVTVQVTNEVQPAEVTIVDSHPTRAVQTVMTDSDGAITKTVTTYEK